MSDMGRISTASDPVTGRSLMLPGAQISSFANKLPLSPTGARIAHEAGIIHAKYERISKSETTIFERRCEEGTQICSADRAKRLIAPLTELTCGVMEYQRQVLRSSFLFLEIN